VHRAATAVLLLALALALAAPAGAQEDDATTICHATGDPQAPYVQLVVDPAELLVHLDHEDDLIPAPARGCPTAAVPTPTQTTTAPAPTATAAPALTAAPPGPTPVPTAEVVQDDAIPAPELPPVRVRPHRIPAARRPPVAQVLAGRFTGTSPSAAVAVPRQAPLPMTGSEAWLVAAMGLGLLMAGSGLRLRFTRA
jgi:LPXTG-motif cell wall-anchored protein